MKKTKEPKLNVRLLRRIQRQLLKEPKQFYMDWWFGTSKEVGWKVPNCGTAACIAGWAVALAGKTKPSVLSNVMWVGDEARKALGLVTSTSDDGGLFSVNQWPEDLRQRFIMAEPGSEEAARIACERIDRFIKEYRG